MACVSSPTLTTTILETTSSVTTTFSNSFTTTPATTLTITSTECLASASASGASGCVSSTVVTSFSTIDAIVNTVQVPVVITVPVTITETETLFGTSCSQSQSQPSQPGPSRSTPQPPPPTRPPPQNSPQPNPNPGPDQSLSSILSEYTPPPVVVSQKGFTTLSDGSVSETILFSTSQPPPSLTYIPTIVPNLQTQQDDQRGGSAVGAIIGGALGGFFGLIAIVLFGWFMIRRKKRWNDINEGDDDNTVSSYGRKHKRFSLEVDDEPKPYQYGLVGLVTPPPGATSSPPSSPHTNNRTLDNSRPSSHVAMTSISSSTRMQSRPPTPGSTLALRTDAPPPATASASSQTPSHSPSNSIVQTPARHSTHQTDYFADIDLPSRVGSPTSFREPIGRLHITNVTHSPTSSVVSFDDAFAPPRRQSVQTRTSMAIDDGNVTHLIDARAGNPPRSPPPYTD